MCDTSTIKVMYYPDRTKTSILVKKNLHKYKKVGGDAEWFTIKEVIEVDRENNRVNVKISGMKNRWIYYLEKDAAKFLEHIRNDAEYPVEKMNQLEQNALIRGPVSEDDEKVFGFRVILQKQQSWNPLKRIADALFLKNIKSGLGLEKHFDAVSVRVYLDEEHKVTHIRIPNYFKKKNLGITSVTAYDQETQTVILHTTTDKKKNKNVTRMTGHGCDRRLLIKGDHVTAEEGKKFLKFLVDRQGSFKINNDITELVGNIEADWDTTQFPQAETNAMAAEESELSATVNNNTRRRLAQVGYYSFIGFNMLLMCCLVVGISFAYHVGTYEANYEPIRW